MVATADGAASLNGVTQGISSDTDRRVFALLRTLCDVILVGASTVREEKYKPARPQELWSHLRDGRPPTPPIAVVTGRLDLDPDSPLITAAPAYARTIVITTASAPDRPAGPARPARGDHHRGPGYRRPQDGGGRAGRTWPPPDARRGRPAPAGSARRGWPAGRAVPDHRPANGRTRRRPYRGRRRDWLRSPVPCRCGWPTCWRTRDFSCAGTSGTIIDPNGPGACPGSGHLARPVHDGRLDQGVAA